MRVKFTNAGMTFGCLATTLQTVMRGGKMETGDKNVQLVWEHTATTSFARPALTNAPLALEFGYFFVVFGLTGPIFALLFEWVGSALFSRVGTGGRVLSSGGSGTSGAGGNDYESQKRFLQFLGSWVLCGVGGGLALGPMSLRTADLVAMCDSWALAHFVGAVALLAPGLVVVRRIHVKQVLLTQGRRGDFFCCFTKEFYSYSSCFSARVVHVQVVVRYRVSVVKNKKVRLIMKRLSSSRVPFE